MYSLWQAAITGYCAVNQFAVVQTFFTVYVFNIQCWSQNTGISKASSRCAEGEDGKEGGRGGGGERMFTLACRWQENSLLFEGTKCDAEIVLHFNLIRFFSPSHSLPLPLFPSLSRCFPISWKRSICLVCKFSRGCWGKAAKMNTKTNAKTNMSATKSVFWMLPMFVIVTRLYTPCTMSDYIPYIYFRTIVMRFLCSASICYY